MEKFFKGIPGSGKIAFGSALVFIKSNIIIPKYSISPGSNSIETEIEKLESALLKTRNQLEALKTDLQESQSAIETGYIESTIMMLEDPLIKERVTEKIKESYLNIEWIFNEVMEEIAGKLQDSGDSYFKDRAPDVLSIGQRVLKNLFGKQEVEIPKNIKDPIVVAHTLSPPEFIHFYKKNIKAVITEIGGKTSHVSIMARDLEIPAVIGVNNITKAAQTGDPIIVDGTIGTVILNPEKDSTTLYKYKIERNKKYEKTLKKITGKACVLKEGTEITLMANLDVEEELNLVTKNYCKGIGLFRTEYIYLNRKQSPGEDEQCEIYKRVIKELSPYRVTIRVIDIGGDKKPPYMSYYEEKNPFLGWRGIRYALSHRELFKEQIRAILRAANFGNARIMFPMVNDLDEIQEIKNVMKECEDELTLKNVPFKRNISSGIMVETPSSIILLDRIADMVDFISVGTNDLIQYTLAIDRGNGMVASEFDPTHPAMLRSLKIINDIASKKGLEVSICGEMAGDPLYTLLLIGLGYKILSMSPVSIPIIKNIVINSSAAESEEIASRALEFTSKKDVNRYIREQMIDRFKILEDYFKSNV
ncbi:MAG: phosphoenolpyruvate--protein phosphotransferase [Spirochaetes bacterium]|nr:phosphoenolpyruvate--protein phosphotransferase [Spirochaetota bacterium]